MKRNENRGKISDEDSWRSGRSSRIQDSLNVVENPMPFSILMDYKNSDIWFPSLIAVDWREGGGGAKHWVCEQETNANPES